MIYNKNREYKFISFERVDLISNPFPIKVQLKGLTLVKLQQVLDNWGPCFQSPIASVQCNHQVSTIDLSMIIQPGRVGGSQQYTSMFMPVKETIQTEGNFIFNATLLMIYELMDQNKITHFAVLAFVKLANNSSIIIY